MMVEHGQVLIENKAVKEFNDVHLAQILTSLKLSGISWDFYSISRYSTLKPEYGESFSNPSSFLRAPANRRFDAPLWFFIFIRIYGTSLGQARSKVACRYLELRAVFGSESRSRGNLLYPPPRIGERVLWFNTKLL
jgi:hypothetical protein